MKTVICEFCGKESIGTERRKFCSVNCRVGYWQKKNAFRLKLNKKAKANRFELPKATKRTPQEISLALFGCMLELKPFLLDGNASALNTMHDLDNLMNTFAEEMNHHEEN